MSNLQLRLLFALTALALGSGASADEDPLRVEEAFRYTVSADDANITVTWDIEDAYYLYRPRMSFASATDGVTLGEPVMPKGKEKEDEFFGKTEIYRGTQVVTIPYTNRAKSSAAILEIRSQGCADMGLCYPPQTWSAPVTLATSRAPPRPRTSCSPAWATTACRSSPPATNSSIPTSRSGFLPTWPTTTPCA